MTAQGKPDRCPVAVYECPWHGRGHDWKCDECHVVGHDSSPVPAARKGSAEMDDGTHIEFAKNIVKAKPAPAAAPHIEYDSAGYPHKVKPSAPQAESVNEIWDIRHPASESVPSGKIAWPQHLDKVTLNPEIHAAAKEYMNSTWRSEGHWTEFIAYFAERMIASQTAARAARGKVVAKLLGVEDVDGVTRNVRAEALAAELAGSREGHRITGDCLKESLERVAELERSNSLLRERLSAIEKILRENERDGFGFCDNCLEFAPNHDENCWLAILLLSFEPQNKENQ